MAKFELSKNPGEPNPPTPESLQPRKPRTLIVEDEPGVKVLLEATLQDVTERVGLYERADDVERMFAERPDDAPPIDWTITDWGLRDGENAGARVVEAIHTRYPNCEITILTGDPGKVTYTADQLQGNRTEVVGKPFNPVAFRQKAQQISHGINAPKPQK